jgi:hypothetical protein
MDSSSRRIPLNTRPEVHVKHTKITGQQFIAHNPQPDNGRGFINFNFEDNRKDCLRDAGDSVCWNATLTMKAFSGTGDAPDPEKDLLLMEATIELESEFAVRPMNPGDSFESSAWYFDEFSKQKLLGKMRLLLLDTEFSQIPLPGTI